LDEVRPSGRDNQAVAAVVEALLREIASLESQLVGALNSRLHALDALKSYADAKGISVADANREEVVLTRLQQSSRGPLTEDDLLLLAELLCELEKRHSRDS
jgi:chorismate mutase